MSGKLSKAVELHCKQLRPGLGAMMVLVVVIAGVLGWVAHRAHVQRDAVAAITKLRRNTRASVYYDWQYVAGQNAEPSGPTWMREVLGKYDEAAKPRGPKWLRDALGPDVFDTVADVSIEGDNVDDELLENVGTLHGVEYLTIHAHAAPDLTPAGMAQLRTLSRLKVLSVRGFTSLAQAVPSPVIRPAIVRFLSGNLGKCHREDNDLHAFRDGLCLLACYSYRSVRFHVISTVDRSVTRLVLAEEV